MKIYSVCSQFQTNGRSSNGKKLAKQKYSEKNQKKENILQKLEQIQCAFNAEYLKLQLVNVDINELVSSVLPLCNCSRNKTH